MEISKIEWLNNCSLICSSKKFLSLLTWNNNVLLFLNLLYKNDHKSNLILQNFINPILISTPFFTFEMTDEYLFNIGFLTLWSSKWLDIFAMI